jgi:hypothetical protein
LPHKFGFLSKLNKAFEVRGIHFRGCPIFYRILLIDAAHIYEVQREIIEMARKGRKINSKQ